MLSRAMHDIFRQLGQAPLERDINFTRQSAEIGVTRSRDAVVVIFRADLSDAAEIATAGSPDLP